MGFELNKYPKLNKWHQRMESIPGFEENVQAAHGLAQYIKSKYGGKIFDF